MKYKRLAAALTVMLIFSFIVLPRLTQDHGKQKSVDYPLAILLALAVSSLTYFLDPRGLKIFLTPRALTNMSLVFILCLCLPMAANLLHMTAPHRLPEQKDPVQGKKEFFRRYGESYNENFAFRGALVRTGNFLKFKLFGVSSVPKVIVGKEGWLFQARRNKAPGTAEYFPSLRPFTQEELEQWRRVLEYRRSWLARRGIYYLLVLAPDKSTVYPEFLPDSLRTFYRSSRLEQLVEHLEKNSPVPVLDLSKPLLAAKNEAVVYYKTDSHWNEYGACIAYCEIARHLQKVLQATGQNIPVTPLDFRFSRTKREKSGGNLAQMLTLQDTEFKEKRIRVKPRGHARSHKVPLPDAYVLPNVKFFAAQRPGAPFSKAVMLHDSFGRKLKPFLSGLFSRILYIRDWGFQFHEDIIEREKPVVVLDEIAEHFLYKIQLSSPE